MTRLFCILAVLISSSLVTWESFADGCADYLKKDAQGASIGIRRIESLKGQNTSLYDVSDYVRERRLPSDRRINIVRLDDLFREGQPFIGFGMPNVFFAFPPSLSESGDWTKFAAKSFRRQASVIEPTRGFVQSGVFIVFPNLDPELSERLYTSALRHVGSKRMTCVNANCRMLSDAGVTIGGESLADYYFPGKLLRDILRFGLEIDGKQIEFDVVRVNPEFLEQVGLSIDRAVGTTFCRHLERGCDARTVAAENTWLTFVKASGQRMLGMFIGKPKTPRDRKILEASVVRLAPDLGDVSSHQIRVSQPSRMGTLLRLLWGPHSLFEMPLEPNLVNRLLPDVLRPFPDRKPSFVTRLKKNLLFSKPVVRLLHSQLASSYRGFEKLSASDLHGMFRTDTPEISNRYNLVIMGDRAALMKISIGRAFVDWVLSKHLILSSYVPDVRFAGEVYKDATGAIHLSANSGTYKPSLEQLEAGAEILRGIFAGVAIVIDEEGWPG